MVDGPRFFFAPLGAKVVQLTPDSDGGAAIVLATGVNGAKGLTVMGPCVYFAASGDGTIQSVAKR